MADSTPDPFEDLVLDDAFVRAAAFREPRMATRRRGGAVRPVRPWYGLALHTVIASGVVVVLAVWTLLGSAGAGTGRQVPSGGAAAGAVPAAEPWIDPVPELEVNVGPAMPVIGPPALG